MSQMISVQVRFPSEELERIDSYVKKGEYPSRAEFIRDAVRKAEMIKALKEMRDIMTEEDMTVDELISGGKEVRKKLYKEMFGAK